MTKVVACIVGPTASGKTALSLDAARLINGEIVSADSMQVYRGMDIGTAKPSEAEQQAVRHHMIGITDPDDSYDVTRYQREAMDCIRDIHSRGHVPIVTGGSGLYVNSLTHVLDFAGAAPDEELRRSLSALSSDELYRILLKEDPEAARRIHPHNTIRVIRALESARCGGAQQPYDFQRCREDFAFVLVGLQPPRDALRENIDRRVDIMFSCGLEDEARDLWAKFPESPVLRRAIGYKEFFEPIDSSCSARELIKTHTRQFAKRQMTWFKRDERIRWFGNGENSQALEYLVTRTRAGE